MNQGSSTGPVGAVTAHHCGTNQDWVGPIDNQPMGRSNAGRPDLDAVVLQGRTYVGRTWTGAHNEFLSAPVTGTATPVVGNQACPNGGYSGIDCRTRITSVGEYFRFEPNGTLIGPAFRTEHTSNVASVGQGDSGGGVVTGSPKGYRGLGIISGIDTGGAGACQGFAPANRECSSLAIHVNLNSVLLQMNLFLRTQPAVP